MGCGVSAGTIAPYKFKNLFANARRHLSEVYTQVHYDFQHMSILVCESFPATAPTSLYKKAAYLITYTPKISANISGATIVASDSIMYLGVSTDSFPHVIFSFGTAPEYDP